MVWSVKEMTENDKYDILTDNISLMIDNAC